MKERDYHASWGKNWHTSPHTAMQGHLSVGVIGINPLKLGDPLFHAQHISTGPPIGVFMFVTTTFNEMVHNV